MRAAGGNHRTLRKYAEQIWLIPVDHFDPDRARNAALGRRSATPLAEILVDGSTFSRGHLKERLFKDGVKARRCEMCGQGERWHGAVMALILDHINGIANDHRLQNLRVVCPNCAATLETHCGRQNRRDRIAQRCPTCGCPFSPSRAKQRYCSRHCATRRDRTRDAQSGGRRVPRPPYNHLLREVQALGYSAVGRRYGVSDNAIRKWLAHYEMVGAADLATMHRSVATRSASPSAATVLAVSGLTVIVLAAGQGTRMRSKTPKALHELCGRPMALWPVVAAQQAGAERVVVVDAPDRPLEAVLGEGVELAVQPQPNGTGGAVIAAASHIGPDSTVVVLSGDVPLVSAEAILGLARAHDAGGAAATLASTVLEDPTGYGRVVRDKSGALLKVVETKVAGDATERELQIDEVNTGIYAFAGAALLRALPRLSADNAQGELYLPQTLDILRADGERVAVHVVDDERLVLGVNDRVALARARAIAQRAICERHMLAGVSIVDPASTLIDVDVQIGQDALIEPGTQLRGRTVVGEAAVVGPHTNVIDSEIAAGARVRMSWLQDAHVGESATVGPFAYLRPGARLGEKSKVGTFVEVKNSQIGDGAKVPHLSYIGDADVGERTNLGAGTITANYDGRQKHRTTIGRDVRGGVDTSFVAPVNVGDGAYTAAGSVITEDVPADALGVARARQVNLKGYAERQRSDRTA